MVTGSFSAVLAVAVSVGSASADSIGASQARANQLAARIASGATQIRVLSRRYQKASDEAAANAAQLASAQAQLSRTQEQVDASRASLRAQAVAAYIDGRSRGSSAGASTTVADVLVRREYLALAAGNVTDGLDRLRAGVQSLRESDAGVRQSQLAARATADRVMQARQAAVAEAHREEAVLNQVQGQLVALVAAATARAQQAQALAAARPVQPPQGLPVNGGIVAVISAATSPSPPPPAGGGVGGVWAKLRQCESGGNYAENTGNGYYGAYQFSQSTWTGLGYPGRPDLAPPAMQDGAAQKLQAASGWGQWPACAAALGLI